MPCPTEARRGRLRLTSSVALALLAVPVLVSAQTQTSELFAGDSVRVDRVLVGRVLNVDGSIATVLSRGRPTCRAGEGHGDAPICDPGPVIRREIDLGESLVERRMRKGNITKRTMVGGVLGFVAFGAAGYFIGPAVGFGKVEGCLVASVAQGCAPEDVVPADELEARQRSADQKKGTLFFGVIGGTATAIFARKLSVGWVRFEPSVPMRPEDPWGLAVVVPGVR